jgi:hypothetical protein
MALSRTAARLLLVGACAAGAASFAVPARAADEAPKTIQRWRLEHRHGPLKLVRVDDGTGKRVSYHYMVITVENKTGLPRPWRPHVVAKTDTNKTYLAGGWTNALEGIRNQEGMPTLAAIESTAGKIEAGQTLTTVAIFGPIDPLYDQFRIELESLVNPFTSLRVLKYGEGKEVVVEAAYYDRNQAVLEELKKAAGGGDLPRPEVEYHDVVEKRAWVMVYQRLGDEYHAEQNPIEFVREGWEVLSFSNPPLRVIKAAGG